MDIKEFIKKQSTINDILNDAIDKFESVGYNVTTQDRIFDAKSGSAEITLKID
jgi:hypothetical protein